MKHNYEEIFDDFFIFIFDNKELKELIDKKFYNVELDWSNCRTNYQYAINDMCDSLSISSVDVDLFNNFNLFVWCGGFSIVSAYKYIEYNIRISVERESNRPNILFFYLIASMPTARKSEENHRELLKCNILDLKNH